MYKLPNRQNELTTNNYKKQIILLNCEFPMVYVNRKRPTVLA